MTLSIRLFLLVLFSFLLTACGGSNITRSHSQVINKIYAQHDSWRGTPYRLGGLSKQGIDCSGLVYLTFKHHFGITLSRTTASQSKEGSSIARRKLNPGDLVFFKTGWRTRHVGIYISDGKFFHASTSKGVTISHLDNKYWKSKYWKSRRVLK